MRIKKKPLVNASFGVAVFALFTASHTAEEWWTWPILGVGVIALIWGVAGSAASFLDNTQPRRKRFALWAQKIGLTLCHSYSNPGNEAEKALATYFKRENTDQVLFFGGYGMLEGSRVIIGEAEILSEKEQEGKTLTIGACCWIDLPFELPGVTVIYPESTKLRLFDIVGQKDINFESDEFSRRYTVRSTDRKTAFALVSAQMIEFLLSLENVLVRFEGQEFWLTYNGDAIDGYEEFTKLLETAQKILALIPEHLRADC